MGAVIDLRPGLFRSIVDCAFLIDLLPPAAR